MKDILESWNQYLSEGKQSYSYGEKDDTDDAVKAIIFNENNEILVLQRAAHMTWNPNVWDLPGGLIKEKESTKQAIRREVKEETGLVIKNIVEIGNVNQITVFKANIRSDKEVELDDENKEYDWIDPSKISEYNFVPFLSDFISEIGDETPT